MIDVQHMKCIQIIITHRCPFKCTHCSQMIPHQKEPFDMSLEEVENALKTLVDYPGHIGIFGGEPTIHPQFKEILALLRKYVPVKARRELWTMGKEWGKHDKDIRETFYPELIAYNEHEAGQACWHQPNQVAADEVFSGMVTGDRDKDKELMWKVIDNCWVQNRWSAAVTPMGAYFCEVAAARAHIFGAPRGITVRKGWWKEPMQTYEFLKGELCPQCSMCLPMDMKPNDKQGYDDISPRLLQRLKNAGSPLARDNKCQAFNVALLQQYYQCREWEPETDYLLRGMWKDFPDWRPHVYRNFNEKKHAPEDVKRHVDKQSGKAEVSGDGKKKAQKG